jgi:hypothetical protein
MAMHTARVLGYAGLIPFIALAGISAFGPLAWHNQALSALVAYGALILSFLGGITWGMAVQEQHADKRLYLLSMVPFFMAWASVLLPIWAGVWLLAVAFLAALGNDYTVSRMNATPSWFFTMRVVLTSVVVACLILAAVTV